MKKYILIFTLLFLCTNVYAVSEYHITTIPRCDGYILVKSAMEEYNVQNCIMANDNIYRCPCALNKKIVLEASPDKGEKIVIEYYMTKYKDGASRITKDFYIEPLPEEVKAKKILSEQEKKKIYFIIFVVFMVFLLICSIIGRYGYKYYKKMLVEDKNET